ncbi:histidine phosphatase family protein [Agrobacterium fabrum]|uniref:histidine phosphatase family protein n=1 Tax=Agrobacterium fabrum TaxID=1176649 RepID=UPI0031386460
MALPTIYLLRHGETLWNSLGRFQGQLDSPLTPRGVEQADQVARLLRDALNNDNQLFQMQISPLGRVRQTVERVQAKLPLPYIEDDRLVEVTTGSWDGLTRFENRQRVSPAILTGPLRSTGISGHQMAKVLMMPASARRHGSWMSGIRPSPFPMVCSSGSFGVFFSGF